MCRKVRIISIFPSQCSTDLCPAEAMVLHQQVSPVLFWQVFLTALCLALMTRTLKLFCFGCFRFLCSISNTNEWTTSSIAGYRPTCTLRSHFQIFSRLKNFFLYPASELLVFRFVDCILRPGDSYSWVSRFIQSYIDVMVELQASLWSTMLFIDARQSSYLYCSFLWKNIFGTESAM